MNNTSQLIVFTTSLVRDGEFDEFFTRLPVLVAATVCPAGETVDVRRYHVVKSDDGQPVQLLPHEVREILTLVRHKGLEALGIKG